MSASNRGTEPVLDDLSRALREIVRAFYACSPVHRPECSPFSERGCTCGLKELRDLIHEQRDLIA